MKPADNLTAPQAIETIRQLLMLSGSRGYDNNWLLNEIAKHVSKFTPLAELAASQPRASKLEPMLLEWRRELVIDRESFAKRDELETFRNREEAARAWQKGTEHVEDCLGHITKLLAALAEPEGEK